MSLTDKMTTLDLLRQGKLQGVRQLTLSAGLIEIPPDLFNLADSLEFLDLSHNNLSSLPDEFAKLTKLKVIFLSNNKFKVLPEVLSQCRSLQMIGCRSNGVELIPDSALPPSLRWLTLTDNRLTAIPDSIGKLTELRKLLLAGNRLSSLPEAMQACLQLELLRISANFFEHLPAWLIQMPRLAWLACAGNPFCASPAKMLAKISSEDLEIGTKLGQGASGTTYQALLHSDLRQVAVKVFKGQITSDGFSDDEIRASLAAGVHSNLVPVIGNVHFNSGEFQGKEGLVLSIVPREYKNLAGPPDFDSCTRDVYSSEIQFSVEQVITIAKGIAAACRHLHERGILHGDMYAHNILVNAEGHSLLGDFGAACCYGVENAHAIGLQKGEVRAFGYLLEEILFRCDKPEDSAIIKLAILKDKCLNLTVKQRPLFDEIYEFLKVI